MSDYLKDRKVLGENKIGEAHLFDLHNLVAEFDEKNLIVHVTGINSLNCQTREQGVALGEKIIELIDSCLNGRRGYLITDYSKVIIDPSLVDLYITYINKIKADYLCKGGIARYGYEITRITAKMGHEMFIGGSLNLFNTKEEAFEFIYRMIEQNGGVPVRPGLAHEKVG